MQFETEYKYKNKWYDVKMCTVQEAKEQVLEEGVYFTSKGSLSCYFYSDGLNLDKEIVGGYQFLLKG